MAKTVIYTCDTNGDHPATLQVTTHAREESTSYTVATSHTCKAHLGVVVEVAYTKRSEDVSAFNRKAAADKTDRSCKGNTKFTEIDVKEISER